MSKKPIKKSDEDKNWISKRKDRAIKSKLEYHLIVCEGTKTEPNYFNATKNKISKDNREKISIKVIGKGRGTISLLEEAIREVKKSLNYISNVWLVYDRDEFTEESFNEVVQKCKELNKVSSTIYHPIWSNECIEIWFLLHFIKIKSSIGRKECIKKLNEIFKKNNLGKYLKNDEGLYDKLRPYLNDAIANAKWLENQYIDKIPSKMNPCTKVYELIELLNKYI